jgi:hypothetical protein
VDVVRRPDDPNPDPPGGRAAERLREFLEGRFPDGEVPLPDGAAGLPERLPNEGGERTPAPDPVAEDADADADADADDDVADDAPIDAGPPAPRLPDDL